MHKLFMFSTLEPAPAPVPAPIAIAVKSDRAKPAKPALALEPEPEPEPEPVLVPAPAPALHMLASRWGLWKSRAGGAWAAPRLIWTVVCVEQLLYVCDELLAVPGADYYLFRAGMEPEWDSEPNASGGKARIMFTRDEDAPVFWLRARDALLDLASGQVDARLADLGLQDMPSESASAGARPPLVTGLALTSRAPRRTIAFWTRRLEARRATLLGALDELAAAHRAEYASAARAPAPAPSETPEAETPESRAAALAAAAACTRAHEWLPHSRYR